MEYCPEIAVFQSALQLIDKQTKGHLLSLSKADCQMFMKIVQTAVTEICCGLEQDTSQKEAENWNQKLHVLCLYSVIVNNYRDPAKKQGDRVPVCSTLDVITGMLPKFGSTFYFEVVKTCSWSQHFLECLEYIDRATALSLLNDYLQHSTCEPVDPADTEVISMVTDKILATCLNLPFVIETNISKLLEPVTKQTKYVQIMYPDIQSSDKEMFKKEENVKVSEEPSYLGEKLWDSFVGKYPDVIVKMFDAFERFLEQKEKMEIDENTLTSDEIWEKVSKMFLFWYLFMLGTNEQEVYVEDDWFVNNLFVKKKEFINSEPVSEDETQLKYCINKSSVEKICKLEHKNRLMDIVRCSFELLCKHTRLVENKATKQAFEEVTDKTCVVNSELDGLKTDKMMIKSNASDVMNEIEDICVLNTKTEQICVNAAILLRMVERTLHDESYCDLQLYDGRIDDAAVNSHVILSSDWSNDVTLHSLLWRIENRLYKYESCLQTLLSETCWQFWKLKRIYEVMKTSTSLLTKKTHVLKCINILEYLLKQHGAPIHDMRDVAKLSFCGLTIQERDAFTAGMYTDRHVDMKNLFGFDARDVFTRQIINVFNKVTAETDDQILDQIFVLFLMDPVSVLETVIPWSLKSEDQAVNLAKVFCNLSETCQTKHPLHHPDTCLMVMMIDRFLKSTRPSGKEEKHFLMFVNTLMKKTTKSCPLPPADFIITSLLDPIDSRNFRTSHHPIRCGFALSMLLVAVESERNTNCDWLKSEFEPVLLIVSLAGILHECIDFWGDDGESESLNGAQTVTMVTGYQKIDMKENILGCLDLVVEMIQDGSMKTLDNESIYWLQTVTSNLNWVVRVRLAKCLYKLGHIQEFAQWLEVFNNLTTNPSDNLPSILLMCVTDMRFIDEIDTKYGDITCIQYEDMITALVQILPNLLMEEVQLLSSVLEMFLEKGLVNMYYRSTAQSPIVLTDLTAIQPLLYLSQLLRDVIITLNVVQGQETSMLKHVTQNYLSLMKTKCSQSFQSVELQAFTLSQIFHHVCVVTETLPQDCVDYGLVLLLHLLTQFKDITKVTTEVKVKSKHKGVEKNRNFGLNMKMVKNIENSMRSAVEILSDEFEEKHMLLKKLSDS